MIAFLHRFKVWFQNYAHDFEITIMIQYLIILRLFCVFCVYNLWGELDSATETV